MDAIQTNEVCVMKINHNLSAVVANNKLHQNEDIVANSMERLASGIRINHAKDDPAGMAISNRMTTQIDGIDRASQNSSDAAAMIETADGAKVKSGVFVLLAKEGGETARFAFSQEGDRVPQRLDVSLKFGSVSARLIPKP